MNNKELPDLSFKAIYSLNKAGFRIVYINNRIYHFTNFEEADSRNISKTTVTGYDVTHLISEMANSTVAIESFFRSKLDALQKVTRAYSHHHDWILFDAI